jgi:hypothetical protein
MKKVLKLLRLWLFIAVAGLFGVFVMQQLWNWFMPESLRPISYGQMFGLYVLFHLLSNRDVIQQEERWERITKLLTFCVPLENRDEVDREMNTFDKESLMSAGWSAFVALARQGGALAVGFGIHTFLM